MTLDYHAEPKNQNLRHIDENIPVRNKFVFFFFDVTLFLKPKSARYGQKNSIHQFFAIIFETIRRKLNGKRLMMLAKKKNRFRERH